MMTLTRAKGKKAKHELLTVTRLYKDTFYRTIKVSPNEYPPIKIELMYEREDEATYKDAAAVQLTIGCDCNSFFWGKDSKGGFEAFLRRAINEIFPTQTSKDRQNITNKIERYILDYCEKKDIIRLV